MKLEIESRHSDYGPDAGGYRVLRLDGKYIGRVDDRALGEKLVEAFNAKCYEFLNADFLELMNDIGRHGHEKYGDDIAAVKGRKPGSRWESEAVVEHAREHLTAYLQDRPHDRFGDLGHQLAAAAFNAMMEFYFSQHEQS